MGEGQLKRKVERDMAAQRDFPDFPKRKLAKNGSQLETLSRKDAGSIVVSDEICDDALSCESVSESLEYSCSESGILSAHPRSREIVKDKKTNKDHDSRILGMKQNRNSKRSNMHDVLFLPGGLSDGDYLAYNVNGKSVIDGYKEGNGIMCNHCNKNISPSQFESHAGRSSRKKPYHNIFTVNGRSLHDMAVSLLQNKDIISCVSTSTSIGDFVARGPQPISSSEFTKIDRKRVQLGLPKLGNNDVQIRILNGKNCSNGNWPLLSKIIGLFRTTFGSLTSYLGDDLIPMMVYGKKKSGQDFRGMHCVLLSVKSIIVSVGLIRVIRNEIVEIPLVATKQKYKGKGYFRALFSYIEKLVCCLKVYKLVVPAMHDAKSMWVNKFGFTEMSQEDALENIEYFGLTEFSGTVMLEKKVPLHI